MKLGVLARIAAIDRLRLPKGDWEDFFQTPCWLAVKKRVAECVDELVDQMLDPSRDEVVADLRGTINGLRIFLGLEEALVADAHADESFGQTEPSRDDVHEAQSLFGELDEKEEQQDE